MPWHTPTLFVFSRLFVPTLVRFLAITLTFLVNVSAFAAQSGVVDPAVFDRPELVESVANGLPFAHRKAADARQLAIIIGKTAIGTAPCSEQQQHVRAVFLAGEVLRVAKEVVDEQGKDGRGSH